MVHGSRSSTFLINAAFAAALAAQLACEHAVTDDASAAAIALASPSNDSAIRAGDDTFLVSITPGTRLEERDGETVVLVKGSANRDLADAFSFVPDDAFGRARVTGRRSFEVALAIGHELNTVLSGLPLFVRLDARREAIGSRTVRLDFGLALSSFSGPRSLFVIEEINDVYANGDVGYRGHVVTSSVTLDGVTVGGQAARIIATSDGTAAYEASYGAVEAALLSADRRPVRVTGLDSSGRRVTKSADIAVVVNGVDLTNDDPYAVWPRPTCDADTQACVEAGGDLGACGDYRVVQSCVLAQARCEDESPPFALTPFDAHGALAEAIAAFNAGCPNGFSWCAIHSVETFTVPACLPATPTLDDVFAVLDEREVQRAETTSQRAAFESFSLFEYSTGGPGFVRAIDVVTGGGPFEGSFSSQPGSCHNCTEYVDDVVMLFHESGVVIRIQGSHGYDS